MASPSALAESLKTALTDRALELANAGGELTLVIRAADLLNVAAQLRDQPQFKFEQLVDLCGLDTWDTATGGVKACATPWSTICCPCR